MRPPQLPKRILCCCPRSFRGQPLPPEPTGQRPAQLAVRPALWVMQPCPTDEAPGLQLLEHPHAEATKVPVADEHCHLAPSILSRQHFAVGTEVMHHFRVRAHRRIRIQIRRAELPEHEPWRTQLHSRSLPIDGSCRTQREPRYRATSLVRKMP